MFAYNYILKPLERERLYRILDRALEELRRESEHRISFSYKSKVYSVDSRNILYIESRDKLILFHMADGNTMQCYGKLDGIEKKLPFRSFIRCHQSFIVNVSSITEMGENYFRIGQVVISISRKYSKPAREHYYEYLFSHMGKSPAN